MRSIFLFTIFFVSQTVFAGGDSFPINVINFKSAKTEFSLTAKPVVEEREWMETNCKEIKVTGSYDTLKWLRYKRPMSEEGHLSAIELLEEAFDNKRKVDFGYIGGGLRKVDTCNYKSKGLFNE